MLGTHLQSTQSDEILKLAAQVLVDDPKNADALMAQARMGLRQRDYAAALEAAKRLCALDPLPQPAAAECGHIYAQLSDHAKSKNSTPNSESVALADRARNYFETAVTETPEDLQSWSRYAYVVLAAHDTEHARLLLPRLKHEWADHMRNEELARSAAQLSEATGDYDSALKFGLVWRKHALSPASRDMADAYVGRLQARIDRNGATQDPSSPTLGPPP